MRNSEVPRGEIARGRPDPRAGAGGSITAPDGEATIRILIVEDHTMFADAIRLTLESHGMDVIAIASNEWEAMETVRREPLDLALVDLGLPGSDGIQVGERILEERPDAKVLAVTALRDARTVSQTLRAGFHGYLTKDIPLSQLVATIRAALGGQVVIPHHLARATAGARTPDEEHAALLREQLTGRELEVLALLVEGSSGEEIAERLSVSKNTVRTHVQNILTKLQVHSRLEAALFAVRHGIAKAPDETHLP
jgi:two-component system nitrate/nitrite response regulator NarL